MAVEWLLTTIGDHVELLTGEAFKSSGFTDSGVRLARGDNVKEGEFEWGDKTRYWPNVSPDLERYLLRDGDVLLGMDGSKVGKNWAQVRPKDLPCLLVQRVARLRGKGTLDQGFLRFVIGNPAFRDYVHRVRTGTSIPHISGGQIKSYRISLPPLPEQKRIAHILGTLDDKIELNRRMNATLEGISRAIFKSWFVDFDPVRQKAAGKQPVGMDAQTAAMFPDSFEDSEIGEVPKEWNVRTVEFLCEFVTSGGTPARKNSEYWEGGDVSWFKTGELLDGPLLESEEHITQKGLANSSCKLWPENTVLFALYASPTVGRLGVLTTRATANQAAAALKARPEYGTAFLVNTLLEAREKLQRIAVGAAQQNINQGILKAHPVIVPPASLAATFSRWADEVFSQRTALAEQSRTLAALRDTLLPKLLSGEIRVPKAEEAVEEVLG